MIGHSIQNYIIISKIGEGGMGTVYLGKHNSLGREVAIKVLLPELSRNVQIKERFINEAVTLSKLNHPNIVIIYDLIEINSDLHIIMEYVKGISLDDLISKNHLKDQAVILKIFSKILEGFSYAHSRGIIHRDIKPSNIILQSNNEPKILDFGIAKILSENLQMTKTGTRMGSVLYMSPEQILGKNVDNKSDIYSLGVTLFEMLTGKLPYITDGKSEFEIQHQIVNQERVSVKNFKPDIDDRISNAIIIALSINPEERFNSCEEFLEYLKGNQSNTQIISDRSQFKREDLSSTRIVNTENFPNQKNNSRRFIYAGVGLIALIISFLVLYFIFTDSKDVIVTQKKAPDNYQNSDKNTDNNISNSESISKTINEQDESDIKNTVNSMLEAWERKNIKDFFKNLTSDYSYKSSAGLTRTYTERKNKAFEIFDANKFINISTWDMTVAANGNEAVVRYNQKYSSTTTNESTVKKLYLRKENNKWLVYKELSGFD